MRFPSAFLPFRLPPVLLAVAAVSPAFGKTLEIRADLEGNGKVRTVSVRHEPPENGKGNLVTVRMEGQEISLERDDFFDQDVKAKAVKTAEKSPRLVLVRLEGPNDFAENLLFALRGGRLIHAGTLSGETAFPGNGSITETSWMGFWNRKRKFVVDPATGLLKEVAQEFYGVNVAARVKESFSVWRTRKLDEEVAKTRADSTIVILAAEPFPDDLNDERRGKIRFLIQTETGWLGWVTQKTLEEKAELPWAG